jgi:hypothetical protein
MIQFVKDNPTIAIVIVVCVTFLLALAMWLGFSELVVIFLIAGLLIVGISFIMTID